MKRWFGVIAVLTVVGIAAALAGFNVWFHYNQSRQIHERWGTAHLMRIANAPKVELVELDRRIVEKPNSTATLLQADGWRQMAERYTDLSHVPGLSNFRYALGQDASYEWGDVPPFQATWGHGILFTDDNGKTLLVFDTENKVISASHDAPPVRLTEKMNEGIKAFLGARLKPTSD
jgi:hypothetical protein